MADLRQRGYRAAVLWVLESNARARRFYEIAGWRSDGTIQTERSSGVELREMRYRVDLHCGDQA
jgi:ribosomal protein S18 acetylase RimI-like enzyme